MLSIDESAVILIDKLKSLGCQIEVDDEKLWVHMTPWDSRYLVREQWSTLKRLEGIISIVKKAFKDAEYEKLVSQ